MYILELKNNENHSVQTDFIISSFNQREILHQGLKQSDDSIRLSIPFSADIWNFINANKLIKAKITEDGAAYFTGYVRPDFDFSKIQRFQPIQLELVNATYITSFYEIEESIAFKDTTLSNIVSNLLERAEITGQDTSFLDEPIIFDIIEEGTTVKDALSQILFEYGYFWDFDKNGEFTVQKIYNKNVTPSVALDGTNILEKVQVSKKEQEFDRVEVEYEQLEKFENILIFQDNTGSGTNKGCFIELGPGKYLGQVEGATSYDITYDSDKGKVIWVDNASLSILSNNKDKVQSTFINKNTKGNLSVYNADLYKSSYILLLEVWGTAYVKTIESATIKVGQDGKSKSIKSKYIHSKAAAENFAKMYYDWGKSCDYVISLQSKLNLDVGTIVEVNAAGKIVGRVIEKITKLDGKPYTYKIEAIKEYELPQITSSILRKSSPIGTAARGTGILKIDTAPTAYTTPVSGITPSYRISKDVVKSQSMANEVYTGDILQYSYYQYQVILVADDYVYTAERTSIRGSTGATGAKGDTGIQGTKTFYSDYPNRIWTNEQWNRYSTVGFIDTWSNSTTDGMRIGDTLVITATLSQKGNSKGQIFTQITSIPTSKNSFGYYEIHTKTVASLIGERGETGATGPIGPKGDKGENGTSVKILGTKPSASDLPSTGEIGDSWLVNGNLYVWADGSWKNVGNIQGPKGDTGKDATQYYIHYVYCDNTDLGTNYSTTDTRKYVGVYVDTTSADAASFAKVPSDVIWSQIEGDQGYSVGNQILRGTLLNNQTTLVSETEATWEKKKWRAASISDSDTTTTRSIVTVTECPDPNITRAFKIVNVAKCSGDVAQGTVPIIPGRVYTISAWVYGTGTIRFQYGKSPYPTYTEDIDQNTWSVKSWTFTAASDSSTSGNNTNIYFGNGGIGTLYIAGMKLELDEGATDWCEYEADKVGAQGTKTFYSDYPNRTWTNKQWDRYSTVGFIDTWSNSTTDGMRIGDTLVITATLSEKGNSKGQIFTQITSIPTSKNSNGYYEIHTKTVSSLIGEKGATGEKGDKGPAGARGSLEFSGTEIYSFSNLTEAAYTITTASTGIISSTMPILVGDTYINTITQDVWICSTAGTPTTAKWKYQGRRCSDKDDSNRFRLFTPATDNGSSSGTIIKTVVKGENPFGKIDDLLKITNTNGPVNSRYVPYNVNTKIDPKKTYRHVTYIKQEDANYIDFMGIAVYEPENSFCLSLNGEALSGGAYFISSSNFGTLGRWYMVVGYIVANGTTTAPADSGVYDMVTKQKVYNVANYQWKPNATYCTNSGCLTRYSPGDSTKAGTAYLYDVRLDEVNGTEPSLNELLNLDTTTKSKGTWKASTVYNIGDIVYLNGNSYICTANHTSDTSFDSGRWNIIASKGDTGATGAKGDTGDTGQRGGRDLAITTAPGAYTTAIGGFTPSYKIELSTVKTQSGIDTVYVGDTLVYGVYRYPVGYVDASYVYTSARTSVKGDTGTKTFYSDYNRTWTNKQWNEYSTVGYTDTWSNSTIDGMRVGDTFVITATLSEKGNSKGQIFTQITEFVKRSDGKYDIAAKTVASLIGEKGATGASSRTIAYRINYDSFANKNDGEMYVCGYNSEGNQADIPGYVIVNGAIHFIKGMFNPNVPTNGYVAAEIGGTIDSPKTPFYVIFDWWSGKYYKMANSQTINGKTWNQLFTEVTNKAAYVVLGKVSSSTGEGALMFEETTPCLLSSIIEDEVNLTYQGVVATTQDMSTSITPYKFTQDANGNWIKTALNAKFVRKWAFVLCMNAETPNSSTAAPVIKLFNGTWWSTVSTNYSYYNSLQSMMAGDLPAVAGYYDTLGLAVPSICGTYIKTLTSNKAFINELFANDITVGNKISTPFTPTTSLRCYIEYANPSIANSWTTDLSKVYNSSGTKPGTSRYSIRFGHQVPGSSARIPLEVSFTCQESVTSVYYAFSTVDNPSEIPSSWTTITKTNFPNRGNISSNYKWLFIKETFKAEASPIIYALPCYTTSTRSNGFEIKSDGSAIFTGKTRFEGGIGIVCDAKDIVRNSSDGLLTITYHFPLDFKIYDVILFLEPALAQGSAVVLYRFTCTQHIKDGHPSIDVYTTYNNSKAFGALIQTSIEPDNVGYDSEQYPNGYINATGVLLQKVVIKQVSSSLPIASVKGVIIPYME